MTLSVSKHNRNGKVYYDLYDQKRINGKVVRKYVGYLGTDPKAKQEIDLRTVRKYIDRLLDIRITNVEIKEVLSKIGIDAGALPVDRIILENDRKRGKLYLRMK